MIKIDESEIKEVNMIGSEPNSVIKKICKLMDIIYNKDNYFSNIDLEFFNINGSVLLYGIPGVGKTTIIYNCLKYALEQYGIESYVLKTTDIIVSNLGQATINLHDELEEFRDLEEGILFLDEIDRLCVNRQNVNEISELKRMLIELMQFLDLIKYSSKKMVIGCTNVIDQLDGALRRRFSFQKEIKEPTVEEKIKFVELCFEKVGCQSYKINPRAIVTEKYKTMDMIKEDFRNVILEGSFDDLKNMFI